MARSRRRKLPTEPFETVIESMSHDGRGVARIDGKTVFIHGTLPGERVRFLYTRKQRRYDEGRVETLLEASPERVEPRCAQYGTCGGCSLQHQAESAQIEAKQQALQDAFQRIGKVSPENLLPPLLSDSSWGYRRKARLGVKYVAKKGKVLVGFRERGTGLVTDTEQCHILHPRVGQMLSGLSRVIGELSVRDRIPQIEVAMGDETCILIFRLLDPLTDSDLEKLITFAGEQNFHAYVQEAGPESIRPLPGQQARLSYALPEQQLSLDFLPGDFTQVNSLLNRKMIARAIELLAPQPTDRVLDLFCGLGNFTLPLAQRAAEVVGVEGDAGLVARARENALNNGLKNTRYYTANLYENLEHHTWLSEKFDKALIDPPRSGAQEVLQYLPKLGIQRLVYVSCYPGTLARDAGILVNQLGYKLRAAGVMDMFPHTAHVESIALFEKS